MKVCIVTQSLGGGGAERSAALQSIMFSNLGYEVHIVLISNFITYQYKGQIFNLGVLKDKKNTFFDKIKRTSILRKYLKSNDFDFIVDNRMRTNGVLNELAICKYAYRTHKVIYVIHSSSYLKELKQQRAIKEWLLKDSFHIVGVNQRLCELIGAVYKKLNISCIENAVDLQAINIQSKQYISLGYSYLLFCGRLEERSKNISLLIEAYAHSKIYNSNVKLLILGDGLDKDRYVKMVKMLNIERDVIFKSFETNPFIYMRNALCTVLTSHYEGFPLVLIESLATGTPVIAINCETGPSEIIQDNINGFLIETYDVKAWSRAFKDIIEKEEMLKYFKENATPSVQKFSKDNIVKKWRAVFEK